MAKPILPESGKKNILITSALPYVNNTPHLGNIIGSVLSADVFARYSRLRGSQTLFVCGTDEYGTATETKALEEGVTPEELCDKYHKIHSDVYEWFNISFDKFGRTPTKQQTDIAQDIFLKLYQNGFLEEQTTTQPFCPQHSGFLADRFVEGECPLCHYPDARGDQCDKCGHLLDPLDLINPKCKLDGATPTPKETKHVFILLDKLQASIEEWSQKSIKEGAWSYNGVAITEGWLKEGLKPRGITRDLKWGTKVPLSGYDDKVLYVWFDACIGYVSITANYTEEWELWWRNPENVRLYQFLGKDNVPFHTVIFPGSQIGTSDTWTMLHHLSTTEYLNYEGGKFSKSRGVGVFGNTAKDTGVPSDVWRFYLLSRRPETGDTEFVWDDFIAANNDVLLKNLGNFINRVIKFVNAKYGNVVPDYTKFSDSYFDAHREEVQKHLYQYIEELDAVKLRAALQTALHVSSLGNKLLQDNRLDNKLFAEQPEKCAAVVGTALNHIHLLASLVQPFLPSTCSSVLKQLNAPVLPIPHVWLADSIKPGHEIGKATYLFSQIKPTQAEIWREQFGGEELKKAKLEAAAAAEAKRAAKKAAKEKKKAKKATGPQENGEVKAPRVEAIKKDGAQASTNEKTAIGEVTEGVEKAVLQS